MALIALSLPSSLKHIFLYIKLKYINIFNIGIPLHKFILDYAVFRFSFPQTELINIWDNYLPYKPHKVGRRKWTKNENRKNQKNKWNGSLRPLQHSRQTQPTPLSASIRCLCHQGKTCVRKFTVTYYSYLLCPRLSFARKL